MKFDKKAPPLGRFLAEAFLEMVHSWDDWVEQVKGLKKMVSFDFQTVAFTGRRR